MANKAKDLTGMKFNRWTVLERDDVDSSGNATWLCECSCEKKTQKSVSSYSLKSGRSKSCGCFAVESSIERNIKKTLDLTGQIFGNWIVLRRGENGKHNSIRWVCQCLCEKKTIKLIVGSQLKAGESKSCGCLSGKLISEKSTIKMIGQKFGRWTVIDRAGSGSSRNALWLCECSCDNKTRKVISGASLRNGTSHSCGCYKKEVISNLALDLTNKKVGKLLCLYKTDKRDNSGNCIWKCQCDCGTLHEASSGALNGGHIKSCGCETKGVVTVGVNDIPTTAPWMIKYFQGGYDEAKLYTKASGKTIRPICPDCGRIKDKSMPISKIYNRNSIGCICGDGISYPNKFMASVLEQENILFSTEYMADWLIREGSKKRFDFFLPEHSCFVEMDGGIGHGKSTYSGSNKTIEETLEDDIWKDKQAIINGYNVFRINADCSEMEYLKYNIIITLKSISDFLSVDWLLCDKAGLNNLVKTVSVYYMKNKYMSTKEIGELFNINRNTVCSYLKKGAKHGWCDYDTNIAKRINAQNSSIRNKEKFSKSVAIYKDGILLNQHPSASELAKVSIEKYGVKLLQSSISSVAIGKRNHHKGYVFKYID